MKAKKILVKRQNVINEVAGQSNQEQIENQNQIPQEVIDLWRKEVWEGGTQLGLNDWISKEKEKHLEIDSRIEDIWKEDVMDNSTTEGLKNWLSPKGMAKGMK